MCFLPSTIHYSTLFLFILFFLEVTYRRITVCYETVLNDLNKTLKLLGSMYPLECVQKPIGLAPFSSLQPAASASKLLSPALTAI